MSIIDLIHDAHHLCMRFGTDFGIKAMPSGISRWGEGGGGGGGTSENIYQYRKSRSSLSILLKRDDDLIVMQNIAFEFRQVLRHYCRYYIQRSINEHLHR